MSLASSCTVMRRFTGMGGGGEANDVVEEGVGGRCDRGSSWSGAAVGMRS